MTEKYYSLLRPFDLEAAKRGEPICLHGGEPARWVEISGNGKENIVERHMDHCGNVVEYLSGGYLRMAPLCWVEGKPVYKGDVLYRRHNGSAGSATAASSAALIFSEWPECRFVHDELTWVPPKVKREGWVNLYPVGASVSLCADASSVYRSREYADLMATPHRVACVRIEWEEPASEGGAAREVLAP